MKIKITICILLASFTLHAQHMNRAGHFCSNKDVQVQYKIDNGNILLKDKNFTLKGSGAFQINNGFVTISGGDENIYSVLRIYDNKGKELFSKQFNQVINFQFSASKTYCAFHDRSSIVVINLINKKIDFYKGSNIFALANNGAVAFYNEALSEINFNESIKINEPVYKILFYKNEPIFITMNHIVMIKNHALVNLFSTDDERVFDATIFENEFYFSTKKALSDRFVFTSFSTLDWQNFEQHEQHEYLLAHALNKHVIKEQTNRSSGNELIMDPIYYYDDTVYQPIGNSYCEMQEYSIGSPYPHPGVDLLGNYLQNVYSVKKGFVKAILTTSAEYHWRVAVANENTSNYSQGYLYAHVVDSLIPYAVGDSVNEGDVVGQLVDFPVAGFVHCHFARIGCTGATWNNDWFTFDNPLSYMTNLFDSIAPTFEKTIGNDAFAFRDVVGNYLSPDSLYGGVQVISKVYDQVNADWHVDVNKLRYSVSPLASPQINLLDFFAYEYDFYNDFYYTGPSYLGLLRTIYSRDFICNTTADYTIRDFYHIVTNSDGNDTIDGNDSLQLFNTASLADGNYIFRITASDPSGNTTNDSMIIKIRNFINGFESHSTHSTLKIINNPSSDGIFKIVNSNENEPLNYIVRNVTGEIILSVSNSTKHFIDISANDAGIYFVTFKGNAKCYKVVKL